MFIPHTQADNACDKTGGRMTVAQLFTIGLPVCHRVV